MLIYDRDWQFIYCANCQSVQPVRTDLVLTDRVSGDAALELTCRQCESLIATLHEAAPGSTDAV